MPEVQVGRMDWGAHAEAISHHVEKHDLYTEQLESLLERLQLRRQQTLVRRLKRLKKVIPSQCLDSHNHPLLWGPPSGRDKGVLASPAGPLAISCPQSCLPVRPLLSGS